MSKLWAWIGMTTLALFAVLVVVLSVVRANAEDYPIKIDRRTKVGDVVWTASRMDLVLSLKQRVADGTPREAKNQVQLDFEGTIETLDVDRRGFERKAVITVDRFVLSVNGKPETTLARGTKIHAEMIDDAPRYTLSEGQVSPGLHGVLADAFSLCSSWFPGEDELFGTPERKKAGDSWAVSPQRIAGVFTKSGSAAKPEDVKGKLTLIRRTTIDNVPALEIDTQYTVANSICSGLLPPGCEAKSGRFETGGRRFIAIDPTLLDPANRFWMRWSHDVRITRPDGTRANGTHLLEKNVRICQKLLTSKNETR